MQEKFNSAEALERLKKIKNIQLEKDIADFLGISRPTLLDWRNKNFVNVSILAEVLTPDEFNYVMTGDLKNAQHNLGVTNSKIDYMQGQIDLLEKKIKELESDLKKNHLEIYQSQNEIDSMRKEMDYYVDENKRLEGLLAKANK